MTKLYSDADLWNAFRQRRRILGIFFAVTGVYLAGFLALFIYYVMLPYEDPNQTWTIAVTCVLTAIYIIFLFPIWGSASNAVTLIARCFVLLLSGLRNIP